MIFQLPLFGVEMSEWAHKIPYFPDSEPINLNAACLVDREQIAIL